jgi:3,4-dihydroxy 2-butanone 4-phosphate synthase/GTP cyclohydrolase II
MTTHKFDTIESAIADIKMGKLVIVVDDEDRENEGDFITAAENATPDLVNFLAAEGRGLICVPITKHRAIELDLNLMVSNNTSLHETPFTVSVDSRLPGTSTGISAFDRSTTIRQLANPMTKPHELARPGHIFPLRAMDGGVLRRAGHTEAAADLARLAGFYPAGVLCEILKEDGTMARVPDLAKIAKKFDLKFITIKDLIEYRMQMDRLVRRAVEVHLPTHLGDFKLIAYESSVDDKNHLALVKGDVADGNPVLVRVHSQCITGDIFASMRCDCGEQLMNAMAMVEKEGRGVVLYMRQEGRGIGLINKLKAYNLQDEGMDTVEANEALGFNADLRDYGIGAQILHDLGIRKMRLMTNNPTKIVGLEGYGLEVTERVSIEVDANVINKSYLKTKRDKMGHFIMTKTAPMHDRELLNKIIK